MGKRIPCILLMVVTLTCVDAIQRTDPNLGRRYGPPSKRPGFAPNGAYPPLQYGPPPSTTGQYMASTGHTSYQSSSSTYGSPMSYPPLEAKPPTTSYGPPPSAPSVSYSRPFGLPEGNRFPNVGYSFKLPQVPPPRPPVKALYISKPYPDYVIRFKAPTYPGEVPVLSKPGYGSGPPAAPSYKPPPSMPSPPSYPLPPSSYQPGAPAPVYSPTGPIKSPIPIYENPSGTDKQMVTVIASTQDVNVGTSYQTGSNVNNYHSGLPSKIPVYSEAPSSVPLYPGQPPSTSAVYVISNDRVSNDKQTGNSNVKHFVELSNDQAFGVTQQPGVIRPLTPDIVYSPNDPNNGAEFKPMYLFGPVFYPKTDAEAKDSSSSGSIAISTELKSAVPSETTTVAPIIVVKNHTVTSSEVADAVEAIDDDSADDTLGKDAGSSSGGTGSRRGILGVVESILGIDDDLDDGMSRADEDEKEEEVEPEEEVKVEDEPNSEVLTSDRDSEGKRKSKPKYKSRSKTRHSSNTRRKNNRNRSKTSNSNRGHDIGGEPLEPVEDKKIEDAPKRPTAAVKNPEPETPLEYGENEHSQGEDEPEPIIGPVQIGYIGRPPQGVEYDPNQPFFYPAGIPPYAAQSFEDGPEQNSGSPSDGVRRHFVSTESPLVYEQSQPQNAHQMDLMVAPTAELEQPVPQEVSALDNLKPDIAGTETSTVAQIQDAPGLNRPMYAYSYPSYYDTAAVQGQRYDAPSVQGQIYDAPSMQGQTYDAPTEQGQSFDGQKSPQGSSYESQDYLSSSQQSSEYAPAQNAASGEQLSVSYSSGAQETSSTAYADNSGSNRTPFQHPSVPSSPYPQVDQDISGTVDASANELSPHINFVSQPGGLADKHDASSISHAPDTQYDYSSPSYSDQWSSSSENAHVVSVESVTEESATLAAPSSTKKPFPSFHHYRVGYRPKYNRNYVAPTTYRPVYHHPSSSTETSKEHALVDDIDNSATIYNSLHYDITTTSAPVSLDEHYDTTTTSAPINLDEHFNFDTTPASVEIITKPNRGSVRYGEKLNIKQKPS